MIYFCADDYGLCDVSSMRIKECTEKGVLNKVSVFPNLDNIDTVKMQKNVTLSLHLNLVEGRCMAKELNLIADTDGIFKHTFGGLLKLYLFHRREFEAEVYKEIKAQVLYWRGILQDEAPFFIDSHQHTHMIPGVFKMLLKVLDDEKIKAQYIRIPAEPVMPYIKEPSLYFTYSCVNLIKQWLLKFLWLINKRRYKSRSIPTAYFMGILFSGKMDGKRVMKVLPHYVKLAEKHKKDIEVLFHPGYIRENELDFKSKNLIFEKFYRSENRETEFDSVMKISLKEE